MSETIYATLNENVVVYYQGEQATIESMKVNDKGELVVELESGTTVVLGNVKGGKGDTGEAAGFGTPTVSVSGLEPGEAPTASVTASGANTEKVFAFDFALPKGDKGDTGTLFTPSIDEDGNVSWTNDGGLSNPETVNIKGSKGDTGDAAGFGEPIISVHGLSPDESPTASVVASGEDTAKVFEFTFGLPKGDKGDTGTVFIPSVDEDGNVSWTNDGGLENPETVNVKGGKGDVGKQGYSVGSIYKKSGTSASGTIDVYGVKLNDPDQTEVGTFEIYNGADGLGVGDMTMAVYDSNADGVVDDSAKLGGQLPEYYATASEVPAKTSDLENDSGFITVDGVPKKSEVSGDSEKLGGQLPEYYAASADIPTKTSELENDSDFATNSDVSTAVAGIVNSAPETLDTLNELAAALGDDPNFATTVATQIGEKVPQTRTINGHTLESDISLSASDIGADESGAASMTVNTHNSDASAHSSLFDSKVPTSRTINDKALSENISLTAGDVGADTSGTASSLIQEHNSASDAHAELFASIASAPNEALMTPSDGQLIDNTIYAMDLRYRTITLSPPMLTKSINLIWWGSNSQTSLPFILRSGSSYTLKVDTSVFLESGVDELTLEYTEKTSSSGVTSTEIGAYTLSSEEGYIEATFTPDEDTCDIAINATASSGTFSEYVSIPATIEGALGWAHGQIVTNASTAVSFSSDSRFIGEVPEFSDNYVYEFDVLNGIWSFTKVVSE